MHQRASIWNSPSDEMLRGGVRDQLSGTFHRYAVDPRWHVPHFEKTLYDNAQLAALYIEAGRELDRPQYVAAGRAVLDDLLAQWKGPAGGFIVGFDADDPNGEGAFYSWTPDELTELLPAAQATAVKIAFDVSEGGEQELSGRSVLHQKPLGEAAKQASMTEQELRTHISQALPIMEKARASRPKPARDDKELASWNALAIMAFADAGRWLSEPKYVEAAVAAGMFIADRCLSDGRLARGFRGHGRLGDGFLDDYALSTLAMIRLHAATGDDKWLRVAMQLGKALHGEFYDDKNVAFMRTRAGHPLPVRMADQDDGVMPSGGSAALLAFLELGALAGDNTLYEISRRMLKRSAGVFAERAFSSGYLFVALDHALGQPREVVIAGDGDSAARLWKEVEPRSHARTLPVRLPASGAPEDLVALYPALAGKKALRGSATAFVCERGRCEAPTSDPRALRKQLSDRPTSQ